MSGFSSENQQNNKLSSDQIQFVQNLVGLITRSYQKNIIGQAEFINSILVCLLCEGHLLVESVPGLAKTRAIKVIASSIHGTYKRVQFTPDLLPADIVGTQIFNQATGEFKTEFGPIFTNFLLADEINRSPAKVQAAMLEAMAERQLSIAGETQELPKPFIVMATQNPIEQEGTYELPEAQLDRFFMKHIMTYPTKQEEVSMLDLLELDSEIKIDTTDKVTTSNIVQAQQITRLVYASDSIKDYITSLTDASRNLDAYSLTSLKGFLRLSLSPRASICMIMASKAYAVLSGRAYVTPDDVKAVAHRVLRHRLGLTYEAELNGVTPDSVINDILSTIQTP